MLGRQAASLVVGRVAKEMQAETAALAATELRGAAPTAARVVARVTAARVAEEVWAEMAVLAEAELRAAAPMETELRVAAPTAVRVVVRVVAVRMVVVKVVVTRVVTMVAVKVAATRAVRMVVVKVAATRAVAMVAVTVAATRVVAMVAVTVAVPRAVIVGGRVGEAEREASSVAPKAEELPAVPVERVTRSTPSARGWVERRCPCTALLPARRSFWVCTVCTVRYAKGAKARGQFVTDSPHQGSHY